MRASFLIPEELVRPASEFGLLARRQRKMSHKRPVIRHVAEWIFTGVLRDIDFIKSAWFVLDTNGADKPQLVRPLSEMRDGNMVAKAIPLPSKHPWPWPDLQLGLQHPLVIIVTRTEHHSMLAKLNRLTITIGRNVFDRENRHCRPNIAYLPAP
jgi:hypothetical protein